MNTYMVELEYTGYITYIVEAKDRREAEDKAWEMLNNDDDYAGRSGDWDVHSVQQLSNEQGWVMLEDKK